MIQYHQFFNGNFVLHKIPMNGHTYSAWYDGTGEMFSAELTMRNGTVRNVSETFQREVWKNLNKIGKRYSTNW